jgi:hypothetical protein
MSRSQICNSVGGTEMRLSFVEARAGRGARVLDKVEPGWHRRIDKDALNIASIKTCALAQLHYSYQAGLLWLSSLGQTAASNMPVRHGFCPTILNVIFNNSTKLTDAWRREIDKRLAADAASPLSHNDNNRAYADAEHSLNAA